MTAPTPHPVPAAGPDPAGVPLDGNALAGALSEVFAADVTAAGATCASCRRAGPLAEVRLFTNAPGLVARCPRCEAVVLRLVRAPGRVWLDLHGLLSLQITVPEED